MLERNLADKVVGVYKTDGSFVHAYAEKNGILYDILGSRKIEDVYLDIFLQFSSKMNIVVQNLIIKDIKGGLDDYYLYDEALQLIDNSHSHSIKKFP